MGDPPPGRLPGIGRGGWLSSDDDHEGRLFRAPGYGLAQPLGSPLGRAVTAGD